MNIANVSMLRLMLYEELSNKFVLSILFLAFGIGIFFSLNHDPTFYFCSLQLVVCFVIFLIIPKNYLLSYLALFMLLTSIGFMACEVRIFAALSPRLDRTIKDANVEATITQIVDNTSTRKLTLDNITISNINLQKIPQFITVSTRSNISGLSIGDKVALTATLMPPALPSIPNGFNYAWFNYFKQIGAIGFAQNRPIKLESRNLNNFSKYINTFRKYLAHRIERSMIRESESSIATAVLIGDTTKINKHNLNALRISGIAHIIAISGLHVILVVSLIFIITKTIFSNVGFLIKRFNSKKIAAAIAIFGSFIYLIISGSPISAQRAFIMSSCALIAIIIDKVPSAIRTITLAAFIILIYSPESLFSASFQMSFAASLSLISCFAYLTKTFKFYTSGSMQKRIAIYILSSIISTLVAGLATAPFAIFHFNQFSTYSLLTNLIAIPLTNFIIMPLGFAGMLLMFLNLESIALIPMGWGIRLMINTAHLISKLPASSFHIASYSSWGLALIATGGLLLCVMITPLRLIGIPLIILGLTSNNSYFRQENPDILIEGSARLFALKINNQYFFSSKAKARFIRNTWQQYLGINNAHIIKELEACKNNICTIKKNNLKAAVIMNEKADLSDICSNNILLNLTDNPIICSKTTIIDKLFLKANGSTFIYLDSETIDSVANNLKNRIWNAQANDL